MSWSQEQFNNYEARRNPTAKTTAGVESESLLHEQIMDYCKSRGWIAFHSRMDKPQHATLGMPDFVIATDDGRTIYAECKKKGAKCSPAQNAVLAWLAHNKQICGVVTTLEEFAALTNQKINEHHNLSQMQ
jgi:hypothetical protein